MADYYYYIDESGSIDGKSKCFILGTIITNTPKEILKNILKLEKEILESKFFSRHKKNFSREGFHASTNHMDIYTRFVNLLNTQNYRAYFVLLNKKTEYFENINEKYLKEEIYDYLLSILLKDRLLRRKDYSNSLVFEQNLPTPTPTRITRRTQQIELIINNINKELKNNDLISTDLKYSVSVHKKDDRILSTIDYLNNIVSYIFGGKNENDKFVVHNYMKENYKMLEPKIGLIYDIANNIYYNPRNKKVDIEEVYIS